MKYYVLLVEGLFAPMPLVLCSEHCVVPKNLRMQLFFVVFGGDLIKQVSTVTGTAVKELTVT